jgi:hypothetical protein
MSATFLLVDEDEDGRSETALKDGEQLLPETHTVVWIYRTSGYIDTSSI